MCYSFTLPLFAANTILVLGDSLSASFGIQSEQGWVKLLQKRLTEKHFNYRVVNASVSGDTTSNGLMRLPKALAQYQPVITIIELGANDGLRGIPVKVIKQNLQSIISLAKSRSSQVLLIGLRLPSNYGTTYNAQFENMFVDLAKQNKIGLVPFFLKGIDTTDQYFQADRLHPTMAAQPILLNNVWVELVNMLSSKKTYQ